MRIDIHMYPSTFRHESRILRITNSLAQEGLFDQIHILATWGERLPESERLDAIRTVCRVRTSWTGSGGGRLRKALRFLEWTLRCLWKFRAREIDCVHPHSLSALPMALMFRLFKRCKVVYDTHEFESETIACQGLHQRAAKLIERCAMPFLDRIVVTSDGFGRLYEQQYGVSNVRVVKNYPVRSQEAPSEDCSLKRRLGLPGDHMLFIYQGLFCAGRGIELLLRAFERSDARKHIVFMGFGDFLPLIQASAARRQNIHVLPGVAPQDVVKHVSTADVGFCLIERTCLSYYHTLPNKMLECLQGGVPVIVSDFPDMGSLVDRYGCGWKIPVEEDKLTELIGQITTEELRRKSEAARRWATECYWEKEVQRYLEMMRSVLGREPGRIIPLDEAKRQTPPQGAARRVSA